MSLKKVTPTEASKLIKEELLIAIDNGDLKALKEIVEKWGFIDVESALRFALGVLVVAGDDKKIHVSQKGIDRNVVPADSLLKQKEPEKPETTTSNGQTT